MCAKTAEKVVADYISPDELAGKLGVSRRTIDSLKADKVISAIRVRGQIRYDYEKVVEELKSAPEPEKKTAAAKN